MRIYIFVLLLLFQAAPYLAAQKIIKQLPIINAGSALNNTIPFNLNPTDTVLFKGVTEIVIGPDVTISSDNEFTALNYSASTYGYFHAYLIPPISFAELKLALDGSYFTTIENMLRFKYEEKYIDGLTLNYQIYDYQRTPMVTTPSLVVQNIGASFFEIDIKAIPNINKKDLTLEENKYYILEVKNGKGDLYKLRFKYIPIL